MIYSKYFLVFLGSGFGGCLRLSMYSLFETSKHSLFGTLAVNMIGCLLSGLFIGLSLSHPQLEAPHLRWLFIIGLLGGFTTFSAFTGDVLTLYLDNQLGGAALHIFTNVFFSLFAAATGFLITQLPVLQSTKMF